MAEYIDRQLCEIVAEYDEYYRLVVSLNKIRKIPAADVAPVVHGRWVRIYEDGEPAIEQHKVGVCCSKCMKMPKDKFTESDYCPHCGAKMDGGQHETD